MRKRLASLLGLFLLTSLAYSDGLVLEKAHRIMADKLYSKGSPRILEFAKNRGYSQAEIESALRLMFDGFAQCSIDFLATRPEPEFRVVLELTAKNSPKEEFINVLGPWVETMKEILDEHNSDILECTESVRKKLNIKLGADFSIDRSPQGEDNFIDGAVVREWGDFIRAKDIRINCRTVQHLMRDVPRPEDYITKCDIKSEFDHPYAAFTDEQLEQIASHDWEAAYLLAYRLLMQPSPGKTRDKNPQTGLSYAMNALVHTGEQQIFELMIRGRHFRNWHVWLMVNPVPNEREVREKAEEYVWNKAGRNLGFIEDDDYRWRRLLGIMQRNEIYFDMNELNTRAADISDGVIRQRSMITGE